MPTLLNPFRFGLAPAANIHVKAVVVNTGTAAAGNTFTATGFIDSTGANFTVKAIVVFRFRQTATGHSAGNPGMVGGFGIANATAERAVGFYEANNALSATTRTAHRDDCCGFRYENNNATNGRASVNSFATPGSVIFDIDQAFTVSERWLVIGFGGTDFDSRIINIAEPATTGAHDVTIASGPGLVPTGALLISGSLAGTGAQTRTDAAATIGFASVGGNQCVFGGGSNSSSDPTVCGQYFRSDECIGNINSDIATVGGRAGLSAADVDELTFTWGATSATSRLTFALVFFGCVVEVNTFTFPTTLDGTVDVSTSSTTRGGITACAYGRTAQSTAGSLNAEDMCLAVGGFDSPTSRASVTWFDNHNDATTSPANSASGSAVLEGIGDSAPVQAAIDVSNISSSTVTFQADINGNATIGGVLHILDS